MGTASQLIDLAPELCDIASQHESVSLTDPATHLGYLDAFAHLTDATEQLAAQVDTLAALQRALADALATERSRAEREDFLAFQLHELDEFDPKPNEDEALTRERGRLRHAERLREATRHAYERLYDGEGALCDELGRLATELTGACAIDVALAPFAQVVEAARSELTEAARALGRYADGVEANPERLAEVEERAFRLQKLLRKHGPTCAELFAHREALRHELLTLGKGADRAVALEASRNEALQVASQAARTLSKARRAASETLGAAIGKELALLGMGRARVVVDVAPVPPGGDGTLAVDGARLTRNGMDRVEFLIAPNRGEEPRALRKIASGGELSRALLALKRVLAGEGPASSYVFDEVDAGVGGAIAEVLGHAIADIARHRQVLCITHLAQIAALADTHFVVDKSETNGRTHTKVRLLDQAERVDEIARMMGGVRVGEAARRAAQELLTPLRPLRGG
jgi:DNA repair protein RecN (Recombination protein N)